MKEGAKGVASTEVVTSESDPTPSGCISIREVQKLSMRERVGEEIALVHAVYPADGEELEIDPDGTNLHVGDVTVQLHRTGCLPEHEGWGSRIEKRVIRCPEDVAQRCGSCVMNCSGGPELLEQILPTPGLMQVDS